MLNDVILLANNQPPTGLVVFVLVILGLLAVGVTYGFCNDSYKRMEEHKDERIAWLKSDYESKLKEAMAFVKKAADGWQIRTFEMEGTNWKCIACPPGSASDAELEAYGKETLVRCHCGKEATVQVGEGDSAELLCQECVSRLVEAT